MLQTISQNKRIIVGASFGALIAFILNYQTNLRTVLMSVGALMIFGASIADRINSRRQFLQVVLAGFCFAFAVVGFSLTMSPRGNFATVADIVRTATYFFYVGAVVGCVPKHAFKGAKVGAIVGVVLGFVLAMVSIVSGENSFHVVIILLFALFGMVYTSLVGAWLNSIGAILLGKE